MCKCIKIIDTEKTKKKIGPIRELNLGPLPFRSNALQKVITKKIHFIKSLTLSQFDHSDLCLYHFAKLVIK